MNPKKYSSLIKVLYLCNLQNKRLFDSAIYLIKNVLQEKMYDFEEKKKNNLIFYGVPQEPRETSEELR